MDYNGRGELSYGCYAGGESNCGTHDTSHNGSQINLVDDLNFDFLYANRFNANLATQICQETNQATSQNAITGTFDSEVLSEFISELPSPESIETKSQKCISHSEDFEAIELSDLLGDRVQIEDGNILSTTNTDTPDTDMSQTIGKSFQNTHESESCSVISEEEQNKQYTEGNQCFDDSVSSDCIQWPLFCSNVASNSEFCSSPNDCAGKISLQCLASIETGSSTDSQVKDNRAIFNNSYSINTPSFEIPIQRNEVKSPNTDISYKAGTFGNFCFGERSLPVKNSLKCEKGLVDLSDSDVKAELFGAKTTSYIQQFIKEGNSLGGENPMSADNGLLKDNKDEPSFDGIHCEDILADTTTDISPSGILPRCRVCSRKATGFHYGVYTCEACKGFFRRSLAKGNSVVYPCRCAKDGSTKWKSGPVKNGCPSCRHKRCVFVGMDKNAIKKGRYTLEQKHKHIDEMQKMLKLYRQKSNQDRQCKQSQKTQDGDQNPRPITTQSLCMTDNNSTNQLMESLNVRMANDHRLTKQSRISEGKILLKDLDELVNTLHYISKKDCRMNHLSPADRNEMMRQRHAECIHQYNIKTALFGEMRPLSKEEHLEIYRATGIDVDDRYDDVRGALAFFERKVRSLIEYAKAIPGFTSLCLDDQANLIKGSRAMSTFIGGYRRFLHGCNMELQVIAVPWGKAYHINELTKIYPRNYFLLKFQLAQEIKNLGLTKEEEFVMRAMSITLGDRCQLRDSAKVHTVNARLMQYFKAILSKRISDPDPMIKNVFAMFLKLRELTDLDNKVLKELFQGWPSLANHRLLHEFFS